MGWPALSDYQEAIQNPGICFKDADLKAGAVEFMAPGQPRVASGNFANVYEVRNGKRCWAVRCFRRDVPDQQRHYALLSQRLAGLWLPCLVDFEYLPEGVLVRGRWHPILKMEWVKGEELTAYVGRHVHEPRRLQNLAAQWRGLVNSLQGNRLAHGDLQHGNALVTAEETIRLVDYDAMFVPALRGKRSPELGHPNYQHPGRTGDDYDDGLDDFAALVIYTSLRALAADATLWPRFHSGENLILSAEDFKNPQRSAAFQELKRSGDAEVQALAAQLEQCCQGKVAQVPQFETVIESLAHARRPAGGTAGAAALQAPASTPAAAQAGPWWSTMLPPSPTAPAAGIVPPAAQQASIPWRVQALERTLAWLRGRAAAAGPLLGAAGRQLARGCAWAAQACARLVVLLARHLWAALRRVARGLGAWYAARPARLRSRLIVGFALSLAGVVAAILFRAGVLGLPAQARARPRPAPPSPKVRGPVDAGRSLSYNWRASGDTRPPIP